MNEMLEQVINRNDTWRGHHRSFLGHSASANSDCHSTEGLATGYASLQRGQKQAAIERDLFFHRREGGIDAP